MNEPIQLHWTPTPCQGQWQRRSQGSLYDLRFMPVLVHPNPPVHAISIPCDLFPHPSSTSQHPQKWLVTEILRWSNMNSLHSFFSFFLSCIPCIHQAYICGASKAKPEIETYVHILNVYKLLTYLISYYNKYNIPSYLGNYIFLMT
jgi:hypothetical protein